MRMDEAKVLLHDQQKWKRFHDCAGNSAFIWQSMEEHYTTLRVFEILTRQGEQQATDFCWLEWGGQEWMVAFIRLVQNYLLITYSEFLQPNQRIMHNVTDRAPHCLDLESTCMLGYVRYAPTGQVNRLVSIFFFSRTCIGSWGRGKEANTHNCWHIYTFAQSKTFSKI